MTALAARTCLLFALVSAPLMALAQGLTSAERSGSLPPGVSVPAREFSRAEGEVVFDRDLLASLPGLRERILGRVLEYPPQWAANISSMPENGPRELAVFIEIFRVMINFVNQFERTRDRVYPTFDDFRDSFVRQIDPRIPNLFFQGEGYRISTSMGMASVRSEGGGGGVRVDVVPMQDARLSFVFYPLYGESRSYSSLSSYATGGSDFLLRASLGVGYHQRFAGRVEPGIQAFVQPQWMDFGQFRVYAETWIRFQVLSEEVQAGPLRVLGIELVPKFVVWHSNDHDGLFGDPVRERLGGYYAALQTNLFAFLNLEIRFDL